MIGLAKVSLGAGKEEKRHILEYYNENCRKLVKEDRQYALQQGDDWCAAFVSVIAHKWGLNINEFPYEVSVREQKKLAEERDTFFTDPDKAKPNDLILFNWNGNDSPNHVGFVVTSEDGYLVSIEGNKDDTVGYRAVHKDSDLIDGFISTPVKPPENPLIDDLAASTLRGDYGTGQVRKALLGSQYEAVQKRINQMLENSF